MQVCTCLTPAWLTLQSDKFITNPVKPVRCKRQRDDWQPVHTMMADQGDGSTVEFRVGNSAYVRGHGFDKEPFSHNFGRPACLVCNKSAQGKDEEGTLVECCRCSYPVHLACHQPEPLLRVPEVHMLALPIGPYQMPLWPLVKLVGTHEPSLVVLVCINGEHFHVT